MKRQRHHIQKQVFDFEFSSKSQALLWQRSMSFDGWRKISAIISSLLDSHDDGRYYLIDKLELDLGSVSEADIPDKIWQTFDSSVSTALKKRASHEGLKSQHGILAYKDLGGQDGEKVLFRSFVFFLRNGFFNWHDEFSTIIQLEKDITDKWPIKTLSADLMAENVLDDLNARKRIYYQFTKPFANAILENYFMTEFRDLEFILIVTDRALKAEILPIASDRAIIAKRGYVLQWIALESVHASTTWPSQFAIFHLKRQFTTMGMSITVSGHKILRSIDLNKKRRPEMETELVRAIRGLSEIFGRLKADYDEVSELPETEDQILSQEVQAAEEIPEDRFLDDLAAGNNITTKNSPPHQVKAHGHENEISGNNGPDASKKNLEATGSEDQEKFSGQAMKDAGSRSLELTGTGEQAPAPIHDKTMAPLSDTELYNPEPDIDALDHDLLIEGERESQESEHAETTKVFYITNSGLILTWPYLSPMFAKLGYTTNRQFVSKEMRERAVHLLGFIATGDITCEEPKLLLSKFLCGWPFQIPVRKNLALTKMEKDEATTMLHNLIANWSILKKTSIEGLRETFFVREGKLNFEEDHWKLIIEQKGTDILLDHLPYSLSIIKLPWLKHLLKVDWA